MLNKSPEDSGCWTPSKWRHKSLMIISKRRPCSIGCSWVWFEKIASYHKSRCENERRFKPPPRGNQGTKGTECTELLPLQDLSKKKNVSWSQQLQGGEIGAKRYRYVSWEPDLRSPKLRVPLHFETWECLGTRDMSAGLFRYFTWWIMDLIPTCYETSKHFDWKSHFDQLMFPNIHFSPQQNNTRNN